MPPFQYVCTVMYLGFLGDCYTGLSTQILMSENTFQIFTFQLQFSKKFVELVINYFPMHLVILKQLSKQEY